MNIPNLFDTSAQLPPGALPIDGLGSHAAALHVAGDTLMPDQVTNLFGVSPTESETPGVALVRPDGSEGRVPSTGRWSLGIAKAGSGAINFNEAIEAVLALLPTDAAIWKAVGALGTMHIALSLAINEDNGEIWLEPRFLGFLGERGVGLYFDIYKPDRDLNAPHYY